MVGLFTSKLVATRGEIWIPTLGILVARLERPLVNKRPGETATPSVGQWDLQASYSLLNKVLLEDDDYEKEWTVWIGPRPLKVLLLEGSKIEIIEHARHLRIEGVNLE